MILQTENHKWEIKFMHDSDAEGRFTLVTVAEVDKENPLNIFPLNGEAFCHPTDQFRRSTGRKVALARALKSLDRATRTQIWNAYFQKVKK